MDIGYLVRRAATERPGAVAAQHRDRACTYADLDDRATRLARGLLSLGLSPGDRVAVLLDNRIEYPEIDVALAYAGLVRVALNIRLSFDEHAFIVDDASVAALITEPAFDEHAEQLAADGLLWIRLDTDRSRSPVLSYEQLLARSSGELALGSRSGEPAWIAYTSGTTGKPKGVVLSHAAITAVAFNMLLGLGPIDPTSSVLLPQPLSHGAGYFVLPHLAVGATVHVMARWDPDEALELGRRHQISMLKVVPTMLVDLLEARGASSYRTIVYGAAAINKQHIDRATERFGPVLTQIYGQSEVPATVTILDRHDHARDGDHLGSAGRPWRSVAVRVVGEDGNDVPVGQPGEVVVRGPQAMEGYLNQPDLTAEVLRDGWIWTRDVGVRDEAGYIYLRGRRDEMINSGGFNIAPKEVEEAISAHPAVEDCIATGMDDERYGQVVRLFVQVRDGETTTADELTEFSRPRLGFRRPRSIVFVDALPRTAYGKVDRKRLQDQVPGGAIDR